MLIDLLFEGLLCPSEALNRSIQIFPTLEAEDVIADSYPRRAVALRLVEDERRKVGDLCRRKDDIFGLGNLFFTAGRR